MNNHDHHHDNDEALGIDEIKDHILVRAWLNRENGKEELDHCLSKVNPQEVSKATLELGQENLVLPHGVFVKLSTKGEERASSLIRRNRLAERLFAVVFNLSEEAVRAQACRMEHEKVLTPEAVEGICSFLGHPPTCPHGRPIPPGDCCKSFVNAVRPLVTPLSQEETGDNYRIIFIAPKYHALLERLSGLGVLPGASLHLLQKRPTFVLKVDETEVAIDREIADGIYVVKQTPG
ncbi:MAG: metal-dependent transcriptional regulator [Deltaproteobacteria bacterium]|nr:metal-dependent transcriptional regulator [Deltaproteobacteria bacterium]